MARYRHVHIYRKVDDEYDYENPHRIFSQVSRATQTVILTGGEVGEVDIRFDGLRLDDALADDVGSNSAALVVDGIQYQPIEVRRVMRMGQRYRVLAQRVDVFPVPLIQRFVYGDDAMEWDGYGFEYRS